LIYFDADFEGPYPEDPPVTIEDLARLYPQASTKAKADEARNERSQAAVAELQAGRPGYRALLRHFIDVSVAALKQDYAFLDVSFDLWKGESDVDHLIAGLVEDFKAKGLAREDDGAWIVDVATAGENVPVEKKGKTTLKNAMPPIMLVNSRGGTGYHTTDLATIADRLASLDPTPERMIYVVDQRQALHFEQVFRAADRAGMIARDRLEHIGFGTVNGTDGKPFKTREGGTLRLADLFKLTLGSVKEKLLSKDRETRKIVVQEGLVESVNRNFRDVSSLPKVKLCQLFVRLMMTVRKTYHSDRFLVSLENENLKKVLDASLEQDDVEAAHIFYAYIYPKKKYKVIEKAILLLISIRLDGVPLESSNEIRESLFREMIDYIENQYCAPIARAALRFADLQNTRTTNYVFDLDRFTSFEGKTGPYLLYAAVRIKSLLRRASDEGLKSGRIIIESDAERALVLALDGFGAAVLAARDKRMPHILCEHVYGLAQAFSAFYGAHPIAAEAVAKTRASRLALSAAVLKQLETGLDLLGIAVPDRM
ncbi:MAG: arginine--tRNA ligase, partial [Pseudomonadota bacterium]